MGSKELYDAMLKHNIEFGLFGHIYESGNNAVLSDCKTPAEEGVWKNSLFLQAGSAGAVPVILTNGGQISGMAHIVEFSGKRGRYRKILPN
jgi:hypothetical protein